jgi:hypothetical protein
MNYKSTDSCLLELVKSSRLKTAHMAGVTGHLTGIEPFSIPLKMQGMLVPICVVHQSNTPYNPWNRVRVPSGVLTQENLPDLVECRIQHNRVFSFVDILFQVRTQARVSDDMISRLLKREKVAARSSVSTHSATTQEIADATISWSDLKAIPSERFIREKTICVEFSKENHNLIVSWVKKVNKIAEEKDLVFTTIIVFANYDNLRGKEIARLRGEYDEAGAMLTNFPDGCKNFKDAFAAYKKEVEQLMIADAIYQTKRQKISTNSLSSI